MTDRELVEPAADACGGIRPDLERQWNGRGLWFSGNGEGLLWAPHEDDGDALRLAVKRRLTLSFEAYDGVEYACATPPGTHQGRDEVIGDDEMAAMRRAILRAAVEPT